MLKVTNLRLPVGSDEDSGLRQRCARLLRVRPSDLEAVRILRKSLDIRDKSRLQWVYSAAVAIPDERRVLADRRVRGVAEYVPTAFELPPPGTEPLEHPPLVIGAGPAGLLAAYFLAEQGYRPIVLERGREVRARIRDVRRFDDGGPHDPESNYLFGEGGAGTFSDGKLTCRSTGPDTQRVLEIFAECKGKPSILYEARPHLGSNRLPAVVKALRQRILALGGDFRFGCRVDDIELRDGAVVGVQTSGGRLPASVAVLATGHSARDTFAMLVERGVAMEPKPFQLGARIEQPQATVTAAQFGTSPQAALLGPADYTLKVHAGEQDLFTFCMCAGGYVMPSVSEPGYFCTNGMSRSKHESPYANSGLVMTIDPWRLGGNAPGRVRDVLAGIAYQRSCERTAFELGGGEYRCPIQWAGDFLAQKATVGRPPSTYPRELVPTNLWEWMPPEVCRVLQEGLPLMDRRWHGQFLADATLVAPEARGSCPVRLTRDPVTLESVSTAGLYPIGEGAGFAGGIISAAVDGLRAAKAIRARYRPG